MFIRLREQTSASCQRMAHIAIYVNLRTRIRAVRLSTCLVWFDFVLRPFSTFKVISGVVNYLTNCSWTSLLGCLPVFGVHSFASNWQLLFLNQRKRENGRRNYFMSKSPRKNVPDVGIEFGAACMPSGHASDRATAPGFLPRVTCVTLWGTLLEHLIIFKLLDGTDSYMVWW